ncbi:Hypothetical predicted protein [Mytilus galloprovincialis]|uniref:DZIP3-like HEPN domain-containing protein n=1 Tax=Mytilus galloprovincialis TaxID=29158 RepID=A0A8B6G845_MYTGA|nr:Hypothetical predicted protein [Mytilus galloprovincialis]
MTSQLTEEETNFTRFFLLNFKVSPEIARRFFDGVFPPSNLPQTINGSICVILSLYKSNRINASQLELLRCVPGTIWPTSLHPMSAVTKATCSKDFDLTLMICLLRNLGSLLTPSNGWDQLPHPNDTIPGASLATLKWFRNKLAHTTVPCMDNNEFSDKWTSVEKALTSLNKGQTPQEVTDILNFDLDGAFTREVANIELKQLKHEYLECEKEKGQIESNFSFYMEGNLPKNIAGVSTQFALMLLACILLSHETYEIFTEANATLVKTWLVEDETFYETMGSEMVYDRVKNCRCILVTSKSGLGKTATIRHIALKLKLHGFEIVPVESPEDIIKYKTKQKQVFLIDDVLGKYDLSPTLLDKWERINEKLISCFGIEIESSKILCTLRLQIALHKRFKNASTILNQEVINLECESNSLSKEEKQKILIKHLTKSKLEEKVRTEEIDIMCESNYAFPLLCKLVSNNVVRFRQRIAFFRQPLSLLKDELNKISNENKTLYCTLVICMLYNGALSRRIFDIDSHECDKKMRRIIQTCGLPTTTSKKELEDSVLSAIGSYFTEDDTNIRFIHDALEETVGCHFCTLNPKIMFSECDILFIRNRVTVHSDTNSSDVEDENIVVIQENDLNKDHMRPLYIRLWNELKKGIFSSLLMSQLFGNRHFVRIFGNYNQSILVSMHTLFFKVSSERFQRDQSIFEKVTECFYGYRDQLVVEKKVEKMFSSDEKFQNKNDAISRVIQAMWSRNTLMYWIVAFGCYEFFRCVWTKMTTLERKLILGRDYLSSPSVKSFFPVAVLGGSIDIVTELISSGADVNCLSEFWETPLYIAVKSGKYDMVLLLLKNGAKINRRGWFAMKIPISVIGNKHEFSSLILEYDLNQTKLHEAVLNNDLEHLRSNIRSDNIDSQTKSGWTVLHYAIILNNVEALQVLLSEIEPENDHYYVDSTQGDQIALSCTQPKPKIDIADSNGLTALHLAVITNNIEIISLLLRNKAVVKVRDYFDRTPLHYIKCESATKTLLTYSSQNQIINNSMNAEEGREYHKSHLSHYRTLFSNITLQTTFRFVRREFVNMPDKEGNTPLHCLMKRHLSKEECCECIETLIQHGADPYLCNDSGTSALEFIDSSRDTASFVADIAAYRKSIEKAHAVFALIMLTLIALTIVIPIYISIKISKERANVFECTGDVTYNITLVQLKRSLCVTLISIVLFMLLSVTFYMRNGVDFSVQCHFVPNITVDGSLIVESGLIDWVYIILA